MRRTLCRGQQQLWWMLTQCLRKSPFSIHCAATDVKPAIRPQTVCRFQCLWCQPLKLCTDYPVGNVLPPPSLCPLNDARWGVCWGESGKTQILWWISPVNFYFWLDFILNDLFIQKKRKKWSLIGDRGSQIHRKWKRAFLLLWFICVCVICNILFYSLTAILLAVVLITWS